jgi:hypothetical protein
VQALKQLLSVLVMRRTRDEVASENYSIPPQHRTLVEVPLQHSDAYVLQLLEKAARQV